MLQDTLNHDVRLKNSSSAKVKFSHKLRKRNDRIGSGTTTTQQHERASFQIDRDARQPDHAGYHLWQDRYAWAVRAGKLVNRRWHRPWDVY